MAHIHWIVRVARAAGLPNAATMEVPLDASPIEAWSLAAESCAIEQPKLAEVIADFFKLGVADFASADPGATKFVPGPIARRFGVFPLHDEDRHLAVATADPCDVQAEQHVGFASGRTPRLHVAPPAVIAEFIDATYSPDRAVEDLLNRIEPEHDPRVTVIEEEQPTQEAMIVVHEDADAGPIVKLTNMILEDAVMKGASDIHIQPLPTGGVIRLRIDGVLRSGITVPLPVLGRVISRIKIMSRLDISDRMRPQDGRARIRIAGHKYDLRISTVPVRGGEKAVIRILDPFGSGALDESGLPAREVQRLRRVLRNRDGILVVTGPTGSGKTTTMYAALREIATEHVNIMTVEDPVEYELPGLTQIQVDPKQGVTFQTALKAILRQDPDVIFVGEIRDEATAEIAAQASLTGHLVLATVHANDAVGSVRRFLDLGLDAGTIAETLRGALAQRLLRTLCTDCAQPVDRELDGAERVLAERFDTQPTMRAVGCDECGHSGYRGRRPVVELILPTQELLALVKDEASHLELLRQARADGLRSMLEGALDLVAEGLTTLAEVERVIGEESSASPRADGAAGRARSEAAAPEADVATPAPAEAPAGRAATPSPAPPREAAPAPPPAAGRARRYIPPPAEPPGAKPPPAQLPGARPSPASPPPESRPAVSPAVSPAPETAEARPRAAPFASLAFHDEGAGAPRVLVVDDDADTRFLIRAVLESHGWHVREASDGTSALAEIRGDDELSLVILDLGLADMDGIDVLRAVRGSIGTAGLPVIVLTGRTDRDTERRVLQEGADDYIRKPVDPPIFLTRAKAVMRRVVRGV